MAAVPVTIVGIQTDELGSRNVTITGMASLTGVGVGGGPVIPPGSLPHPEHPIVIPPTPPSDAHPEHPIVIPPDVWPNPPDPDAPHPEHPIVIPPPPEIGDGTPPLQAKVVWVPPGYPSSGWNVIFIPTGEHPAPGRRR